LDLDAEFADAHVGLGVVSEMRKDWTSSLKHFEKALALEPENVEYHILLGGILRKIGMHDEAGLIYANALRLEPDNLEVFLEAADNLQKDDRHNEALALLDGVPLTSTHDPLVVCRRFVSLYRLGQTKQAYSLLDVSLEKTPDLCTTLVELFPGIAQDAEFSLRVLNAPKNL
jgi:tetratricopeptide (TPR) repeat protein